MAERISTGYKRLFDLHLLHHYWLDDGIVVFDQIADKAKKYQRLLTYDMRSFLALAPAPATIKIIRSLGCIYKNTALGCVMAIPADTKIPAATSFNFIVTVQSAAFFNYTALTLRPRKIYELYQPSEDRTYRYKENVPVLSNLTGTFKDEKLFLSREYSEFTATDQIEALGKSGADLLQLTGDQPGAGTNRLGELNKLPVFVHQNDVPVITPPSSLSGVPGRGILLSNDIPDDVFALIQLSAVSPDKEEFSLINDQGRAKLLPPVFQARFKNRATIWQYFNKDTHGKISEEATPFPFTQFGNVSEKSKPQPPFTQFVNVSEIPKPQPEVVKVEHCRRHRLECARAARCALR